MPAKDNLNMKIRDFSQTTENPRNLIFFILYFWMLHIETKKNTLRYFYVAADGSIKN